MSDVVRLRVGGVVFEAEKESLLRFDHTFFHGLFSSGGWQPDADGAYFIDRPALAFDRILEYLSSGELRVDRLTQLEEECMYSSLDYLLIPYKREWQYNTHSMVRGFSASYVCELTDGRLCGAYENDIIVCNVDTSVVEMTMKGHTRIICQIIQLHDGRICSCSADTTVKLWNIESGLCELTLTGYTSRVKCILQLFDGRLCSGSGSLLDSTIRVWKISTGACEMSILAQFRIHCITPLADGRVCCGDSGGTIYIYSLLTGECELSWEAHNAVITTIVCIDAARICSCSNDCRVKIFLTASGECEKILNSQVSSMVLLRDGRLCSIGGGYREGAIKLWNLDTEECTLEYAYDRGIKNDKMQQIFQMNDGRIVYVDFDSLVYILHYVYLNCAKEEDQRIQCSVRMKRSESSRVCLLS